MLYEREMTHSERAIEDERKAKSKPEWDAKFMFEFIEWMEKYFDEKGHYPPPMQCYMFIMQKLK